MKNLLMIDDDPYLGQSVSQLLAGHGYELRIAESAADGFSQIQMREPSLLILDLSLPDEDGVSLCRRIRAKWTFPILMLTSRTDLLDKVVGLEVGADDYLTKPFDGRELIARVRACLRRTSEYKAPESVREIVLGSLKIALDSHQVTVDDIPIPLTAIEFRLLAMLAEKPGRVFERSQLFERVWGYEEEFNSNSLDVFIYRLRSKLESAGSKQLIRTVRGIGYKIQAD